jgi:hypothetical protein
VPQISVSPSPVLGDSRNQQPFQEDHRYRQKTIQDRHVSSATMKIASIQDDDQSKVRHIVDITFNAEEEYR